MSSVEERRVAQQRRGAKVLSLVAGAAVEQRERGASDVADGPTRQVKELRTHVPLKQSNPHKTKDDSVAARGRSR